MKPVSFSPPVDGNGVPVPDYVATALTIEAKGYLSGWSSYEKLAREFSTLVRDQTSLSSGLVLKGLQYKPHNLGAREQKVLAELAKTEPLPTFELIHLISRGKLVLEVYNAVSAVLIQEKYLRWSAARTISSFRGAWSALYITLYFLSVLVLAWVGWWIGFAALMLAIAVGWIAAIWTELERRNWRLSKKGRQLLVEAAQYQKVKDAVSNGAHYFGDSFDKKSANRSVGRRKPAGGMKTRSLARVFVEKELV